MYVGIVNGCGTRVMSRAVYKIINILEKKSTNTYTHTHTFGLVLNITSTLPSTSFPSTPPSVSSLTLLRLRNTYLCPQSEDKEHYSSLIYSFFNGNVTILSTEDYCFLSSSPYPILSIHSCPQKCAPYAETQTVIFSSFFPLSLPSETLSLSLFLLSPSNPSESSPSLPCKQELYAFLSCLITSLSSPLQRLSLFLAFPSLIVLYSRRLFRASKKVASYSFLLDLIYSLA